MRKPNAVAHMTLYGLIYGFLLAMIYSWIGVVIWSENIGIQTIIDYIIPSAFVSFLFGALPGGLFGLIDGSILGFLASYIRVPIDVIGFRQWRNLSHIIIGGLTFAGMSLLTLPAAILLSSPDVSVAGTQWNVLWFILPIPIATFAAIYAVHRYFLKLRAWGSVGKAKNKAKHGLTNQLAYEDSAGVGNYLADEGVVEQQRK